MTRGPETLTEVAAATLADGRFGLHLRHFLDVFLAGPTAAALAEEPPSLAGRGEEGLGQDAFLAAAGEHLAAQHGFPVQPWTWRPGRILAKPLFSMETPECRIFLLVDSPAAFKARNLFVGADVLTRV